MITIERNNRRTDVQISRRHGQMNPRANSRPQFGMNTRLMTRAILLAFVALILAGCTNSKVVIGPLYNRLDDQMRGEFHKLAKWNDDQIEHFEARVGTFHVWHRQEELPKYAALLNTIQKSIRERGTTSAADVRGWVDSAEVYSRNARVCHPVNYSFDLMQTLTDKQVNFIERRFISERKKNFKRYSDSTPEARRERRVGNIVKWASRIGFDFNNTQKRMLTKAMAQQISMRRQYYGLVDIWAKELFSIARQQEATNYEQNMQTQVTKLWSLLEKAHNEEWQANRKLWRDFGYEFVQSLSYDQRIHASNWLKKMSATTRAIARDEPSFKVSNNPEHGCMVGQPISG